jgi:hypothetical protein
MRAARVQLKESGLRRRVRHAASMLREIDLPTLGIRMTGSHFMPGYT